MSILSSDNKNAIANYGRRAGFNSSAEADIGWAMDTFWMDTYGKAFGGFTTISDKKGFLTLCTFPMTNDPERILWSSVCADYGDAVHGVFLRPERYDGRTVWVISNYCSLQDMTDAYNCANGTQVARHIPQHETLKAGTPGKTKEVNGLRNYCRYMRGNYWNCRPTDDDLFREMGELKRAASESRGRGGASNPRTTDGFICAYCPVRQANKSTLPTNGST